MGLIVPIWKRKGDMHDPGKYRGVTLLSQVLKIRFPRVQRIVVYVKLLYNWLKTLL